MNAFIPRPYPIASFPLHIRSAVLEIMRLAQTTDVIASMSVLTALSVAIGCNADWRHPVTGQIRPSTLYLWLVALSGERKTPSDGHACGPVYAHDISALRKFDEEDRTYRSVNAAWSAIQKGLLSRIAKLSRAGEPTADAEAEVAAHALRKPIKPVLSRLISQDSTYRALCEALEGDGKSVALVTDEGETMLSGSLMRQVGPLNKFWDAAAFLTYDRADHDNIVILNPRVTISMMVQPSRMAEYLCKQGEKARGSGHWARYLIARSPTIQGFRSVIANNSALVDLVPYHARLADLLRCYDARAKRGAVIRDVVEFDDGAAQLWLQIAARVEADIKPGYFLNDIGDFASKYMDIVGRIAVLLYYFDADTADVSDDPAVREHRIGKISGDTLTRAEQIAAWHLLEFKEVFSPAQQRSPEQNDADMLYAYLYRTYFARSTLEVAKNLVRQYCGVRHGRFDPAIRVLINTQTINIKLGKNNTQLIELNPDVFSRYPI